MSNNSQRHEIMRLISFLNGNKLSFIFALIGECSLNAAQPIIFAYVLKSMADSTTKGDFSILISSSILLCVFIVIFSLIVPLTSYSLQATVQKVMFRVRTKLFSHIQKLPISYFELNHSGDIISRFNNDALALEQFFGSYFRQLTQFVFYGISCGAAMLILDSRFAVVLMIIALVAIYLNKKISKPLRAVNDEILQQMSRLTEKLLDLLAGIQVTKMFPIKNIINSRYQNENIKLTKLMRKEGHLKALLESTDFFIGFVSFIGIVGVGMFMVNSGTIEYGKLLALVPLQMTIVIVFRELGNIISNLQTSLAGSSRIMQIFDTSLEGEKYYVYSTDKYSDMINISNVTFSYDNNTNALEDLSLTVPKGTVVALVGPSGGGKSTILKMLLGFYPPASGDISINGLSLGAYSLSELRDQVSYVPQDAFLFEGTIEENIRYGDILASNEEIIRAAQAAHAHDFITNLPNGYNTQVGERGTSLSGGQRQRIAIARALLKKSPILLFDEATSALDNESELLVQQAIQSLMHDRTTIVIAHRLSTIKHSDMICVIDRGHVIEQGTHEELSSQDEGVYKRLLKMQYSKPTP